MPRGVPNSGYRKTKNFIEKNGMQKDLAVAKVVMAPVPHETEEQIEKKLSERFETLDTMTLATVKGQNKSMIISGPAGVGKSYSIGVVLDNHQRQVYSTVIKGHVAATGLYRTLYEFRHKNCVVVFDDADSIFADEVALNLLKAACDTTKKRTLRWLTETKMEDENGDRIERQFDFDGSIIFITNYDFDHMIHRGSKLSPHFEALVSRSHYLDLGMKSVDDYVVRIKQVVRDHGMLHDNGFSEDEEKSIIDYVTENKLRLRELSLRMVLKLANLMRIDAQNWQTLAKTTCLKQGT